jgi:hypothetical protein
MVSEDVIDRRAPYAESSANGLDDSYSVHISTGSYNQSNNTQAGSQVVAPLQATTAQQTATRDVSRTTANNARNINRELNRAALAYTKCSILFFTAMLVTWIPSSANRIYSLVHGNEICIPLEFMAAFVLPLQGFWNAVIYIATSWSACLDFVNGMKKRSTIHGSIGGRHGDIDRESWGRFHWRRFKSPGGGPLILDSDSTIELAKAPRTSADRSHSCRDTTAP